MRVFRLSLAALIVLALAAGAIWVVAPPKYVDWDRLQAGIVVHTPDGEGPFPIAVLMHGCGGERPFLDGYVEAALEAGVAAVTMDSLAPRGIGRARAVMSVCTGWRLRGGARTRDAALLLENLDDPRLDMSRVSLAGWSHGAWTAAELLTRDPVEFGVRSAFLVYPYCRFPARWPGREPPDGVRILAVIPGEDVVGDAPACREALARSGAETVTVEGATHAFEEDDSPFSPFRYDDDAFRENRERFTVFLRQTLTGAADVSAAAGDPLPAGGAND